VGASIDHIRDSYRLLTRKTFITDIAYRILTDPKERRQYNAELLEGSQPTVTRDNQSAGDYQRGALDAAGSNRSKALSLLRDYGFRDRTAQVEDAPSWSAFMQANGSGTERYFFSGDNQYLLLVDFSPFIPAGEGWHTLNWWLFKASENGWELVRDGEFGDDSLQSALLSTASTHPEEGYREDGHRTGHHDWIDWGATREMPKKPDITTHTELHYIAGIGKMFRSGITLGAMLDTVLDCSPERLRDVWGITVETQSDMESLVKYVQWLCDLAVWYRSLPNDLAAMVAEGLESIRDGRYMFLATRLRQ
jgi:hypothetical protein